MSDLNKKKMEEVAVYWTNAQLIVSSYILSIVTRCQDADDILQQVAVAVVKDYDNYDKRLSFIGWAIGIAKNQIRMYMRKHYTNRLIFDVKTVERISEAYEKEADKFQDIRHALDFCIKKLKGNARQVLEMRYLRELSVLRISQKLGMTPGSTYTLLHRIRLGLQECIRNRMAIEDNRNV